MTPTLDLSHPQRRAVDLINEVAGEKDCRPFLVGGPVRDLLLERQVLDLDLTLEQGSSTLARALARRIDGRVRSHPQFLTYKVTAEGFPEIDIATARKERYRAPGSLPTVTPGTLRDDLLRRDFTVNAMAMDLLDGTLHDPAGGQRDLEARIIRVLHDSSFVDDPTRIFRALRLGRRLGFSLEFHTGRLMRDAIEAGALQMVSKERLWRELFLAMDECDATGVLAALGREGALDSILGAGVRSLDERALDRVAREVAGPSALDRHVLYTAALLRGNEPQAEGLEGSGFSQKRVRKVLQIARELDRFERALGEASSDRQRFRLLKTASPEMAALIVAERPDLAGHIARFEEFRSFRLPLRGNELEVSGGPHVARALERTREAVFNGEIPADQARSFARDLAIKYLGHE